jgi:hypothetical protein
MIYYSTGKGIHLNIRGKKVDLDEKSAKLLLDRGLIVKTKEELQPEIAEVEIPMPVKTVEKAEVKPQEKPVEKKAKKPATKKKKAKAIKTAK